MTTDALLSTGGNLTPSHAAPLHVTVPPAALPGTAVFQKKKKQTKNHTPFSRRPNCIVVHSRSGQMAPSDV